MELKWEKTKNNNQTIEFLGYRYTIFHLSYGKRRVGIMETKPGDEKGKSRKEYFYDVESAKNYVEDVILRSLI